MIRKLLDETGRDAVHQQVAARLAAEVLERQDGDDGLRDGTRCSGNQAGESAAEASTVSGPASTDFQADTATRSTAAAAVAW